MTGALFPQLEAYTLQSSQGLMEAGLANSYGSIY